MQNMQNNLEDNKLDTWQQALLAEFNKLKECQFNKKINSCMKCQAILECEIRKNYVNAVYRSMNKGQDGGFEF